MTASAPSMALNNRVESDGLSEFFIKSGLTFQLYEKGGSDNELLVITQGGRAEDFGVGGHDSPAGDSVAGRSGSGQASLEIPESG